MGNKKILFLLILLFAPIIVFATDNIDNNDKTENYYVNSETKDDEELDETDVYSPENPKPVSNLKFILEWVGFFGVVYVISLIVEKRKKKD